MPRRSGCSAGLGLAFPADAAQGQGYVEQAVLTRDRRRALPALVAFKREEANIQMTELADTLQVSAEDVYDMESGWLNVRDLDAERIVTWVRTVRADPAVAVAPRGTC